MLTSEHHLVLEEIGRLEKERAALDDRIRRLRMTLPKVDPEPKPIQPKIVLPDNDDDELTEYQSLPVQEILAPDRRPDDPVISDHAVIRYLERQHDFDFRKLKESLLTNAVKLGIRMGARSVKCDGGKFMIRGNKVTTFISNNHRQKVYKGRR